MAEVWNEWLWLCVVSPKGGGPSFPLDAFSIYLAAETREKIRRMTLIRLRKMKRMRKMKEMKKRGMIMIIMMMMMMMMIIITRMWRRRGNICSLMSC